MNTLESFFTAQNEYKKLLKIERQIIKSAVKDYQINELVKQCSEAKITRNKQLKALLQHQAMATVTLTGLTLLPFLTLAAF